MQKHEKKELYKSSFFFNDADNLSSNKKELVYQNIGKSNLNFNKINFNRVVKNYTRYNLFIYLHVSKRTTRLTAVNSNGLVLLTLSVGFQFKKSNRKGVFSALRLFSHFLKVFNKSKNLN